MSSSTTLESPAASAAPGLPLDRLPQADAAASAPAWWRAAQEEAWGRYEKLPAPHRKEEGWRFTDLARVATEGFRAALPVSAAARAEIEKAGGSLYGKAPAGRVCYANDTLLVHEPISKELAAQGVVFLPLAEALRDAKASALLKKYFMARETGLGARRFEALHRAFCRAGILLYVPAGVEVKAPLQASFWLADAEAAVFPHTLIIAEDNAQVSLEVTYASTTGARGGFACVAGDVYAGAGARVRHVAVQNWDEKAVSLQLGSTTVEKDGHAASLHLNLGSHYARMENRSRMMGSGARSEMFSLTAAHGTQEFDQRTYQEHAAPNTTSDLLYKNALADTAHTIFAGMIRVDPGAQQTDAYQSNRNLLLSPTAQASSLPGLEIEANEVRCTHGATAGQISPEELFYMAQRGIPTPVARHLFVLGFFDEVLERLNDPELSASLHRLLEEKFARATA
ncbi:MAG: Fe-S cluster assembly protein SufD [Verrucomicrobium sp.]|nr:Fe-S cluster assembly protein SufD [Verrucomicrobium sp.]